MWVEMHDIARKAVNKIVERDDSASLGELSDLCFYIVEGGRASFDARPPVVSFVQEQLPLGDAVGVAEECSHRQFLRRARDGEQLQAGFVRQTVALAGVHVLARPDEVFPRVLRE